MKKLTVSLLSASLLAGVLFANEVQVDNGKVMNHSNLSGMTDKQVAKMMDSCKQSFLKSQKQEVSSVESKQLQKLSNNDVIDPEVYSGF